MKPFQSGVILNSGCVLDGINHLQMILIGRWDLVRRPLRLRAQLLAKEVQVRIFYDNDDVNGDLNSIHSLKLLLLESDESFLNKRRCA